MARAFYCARSVSRCGRWRAAQSLAPSHAGMGPVAELRQIGEDRGGGSALAGVGILSRTASMRSMLRRSAERCSADINCAEPRLSAVTTIAFNLETSDASKPELEQHKIANVFPVDRRAGGRFCALDGRLPLFAKQPAARGHDATNQGTGLSAFKRLHQRTPSAGLGAGRRRRRDTIAREAPSARTTSAIVSIDFCTCWSDGLHQFSEIVPVTCVAVSIQA